MKKYVKTHEWVEETDHDTVLVGISDYAQQELGDLVFVNLPEVGDEVTCGEAFGDVESVKAVSDIFSPVRGVVKAINEELVDAPEMINEQPLEAWFIEVEQVSYDEELMDEEAYAAFVESLA